MQTHFWDHPVVLLIFETVHSIALRHAEAFCPYAESCVPVPCPFYLPLPGHNPLLPPFILLFAQLPAFHMQRAASSVAVSMLEIFFPYVMWKVPFSSALVRFRSKIRENRRNTVFIEHDYQNSQPSSRPLLVYIVSFFSLEWPGKQDYVLFSLKSAWRVLLCVLAGQQ